MSGTVNISRSIWTDAAFKDEPMTEREAFVWIIMEASYKPREKRVGAVTVNLERGQLVTSVRFMCEAWDWSKSRVDRFLKRLEKRDMIGTDSGTGINVITVSKYNDYQNTPAGSGTPKLPKRDSNGTAAGQQRDKPNTGLIPEVIQKKEDATASLYGFDEFWKIWPDKTNKEKARKAWKPLSVENKRLAFSAIRDGWFDRWRQSKPDANPIHAATFLNSKRWTDQFNDQQLKAINGGSHGQQPTNKSQARMDAFIAGARGANGA